MLTSENFVWVMQCKYNVQYYANSGRFAKGTQAQAQLLASQGKERLLFSPKKTLNANEAADSIPDFNSNQQQ